METVINPTEILLREGDKIVGRIEFELQDNVLSILHTYAYESGRGIGSMLMKATLALAEQHQYTVHPVCSFAQKYIEEKDRQ